MKRVFAVIIAIMLFALCGCSGQKTYSLEEVQKTVDDFFGMEYTVSELNDYEIYGVDSVTEIYINAYDYDVKFDIICINVFDKEKEAKAYLEKFKNNEFRRFHTTKEDCGDNYCLALDYGYCDVGAKMCIYQKHNLTISVWAVYGDNESVKKILNSFLNDDIPKFFDALG